MKINIFCPCQLWTDILEYAIITSNHPTGGYMQKTKTCQIDIITDTLYAENKIMGIGYIDKTPIIFTASDTFHPDNFGICAFGQTCFTDNFCLENCEITVVLNNTMFLSEGVIYQVKNHVWETI